MNEKRFRAFSGKVQRGFPSKTRQNKDSRARSRLEEQGTRSRVSTLVTSEGFDPQAEAAAFADCFRGAGAFVTFVGDVRSEEGRVASLVLEHYPGFTEKEIDKIASSAIGRWPLLGVRIVHRVGALGPGEPIVFVAAAAAHRRPAFEAAEFLMDYLKSEAPFWKKEIAGGEERWVEPRAEDIAGKTRWRAAE